MQLESVFYISPIQDAHPAQEDATQKSSLLVEVLSSLIEGHRTSDIVAFAGGVMNRLGDMVKAGRGLRPAFAALSQADQETLRDRIGHRSLQQLLALSQETDSKLLSEALLHFGVSLKGRHDLEGAAVVLGWLTEKFPAIAPELRQQAEAELNAILGKGDLGLRLETLSATIPKESTNWRMIGPMFGASILGNLVGTGVLGRVLSGTGGWLKSGLTARVTSGAAAWTVEFPLFAGLSHAVALQPQSFLTSLESAAKTLGILKSFHFLGRQGFRKVHGIDGQGVPQRLAGLTKLSVPLFPQTATFLGLATVHHWDNPETDGVTLAAETLFAMLTLGIGGSLGGRFLGRRFGDFQQALRSQAEHWVGKGGRESGEGLLGSMFQNSMGNYAYAGTPSPLPLSPRGEGRSSWRDLFPDHWFAKGGGEGGGGFWRPKKGSGVSSGFVAELDKLAKKGDANAAQLLDKLAEPAPPPAPVEASLVPGFLSVPETVVIPAGSFRMGAKGLAEARPVHEVYVSEFEIGKYLGTNQEYGEYLGRLGKHRFAALKTNLETGLAAFVGWEASKTSVKRLADKVMGLEGANHVAVKIFEIPKRHPSPPGFDHDRQPVVNVNWLEAMAFTAAAKGRLPTEAEWEKAAVGPKNYRYATQSGELNKKEAHYNARATAPVGSYPPNEYGLHDMTGNAWEWVGDWYGPYEPSRSLQALNYRQNAMPTDPTGPVSGEYKVLRGGSWDGNHPDDLRAAFRSYGLLPEFRYDFIGLRFLRSPQD